ncbi:uncharacterized protein LOC114270573 [Camellia sinensis]|uniref:uncharacterized protein LOC114270573 n=1 Tax=Camellia sinensis TaxID=4442 RepID=UPI0010361B30|nr:uncharacterized protein LOC114270573 [Camellia sinensis]
MRWIVVIIIFGGVMRYASTRFIGCSPPPTREFKLNTYGAAKVNTNVASGGGLIKDEHGNWIKGFYRNIGTASTVETKLWALWDGLRLALELDLKGIHVETDAQVTSNLQNSFENHHFNNLISDCRFLMSQLEVANVEHIFREANKCEDILAN